MQQPISSTLKNIPFFFLILATNIGLASELSISKPILYLEGTTAYTVFNLSWKNAWHNERNYDAIWLFGKLKSKDGPSRHLPFLQTGHRVVNVFGEPDPNLIFAVAPDGVGLHIFPSQPFRGDINVTLKIAVAPESFAGTDTRNSSFDIFGVEMVEIPSDGYFLGSPDPVNRDHGQFYNPKKHQSNGLVRVESEQQEIEISPEGDLYFEVKEGYEGEPKGRIPSTYPKGFDSFYIMKYELTEGQYVDFLNNLSDEQQQSRRIDREDDYSGSIVVVDDEFITRSPDRPCPFVGWDDAMAYADWAGLRPMTELEYTKAARGPAMPTGPDFPWGLAGKEHIQRLPDHAGNLIMRNGWKESLMSDDHKKYFGASHYWVMDLAGSLWERVITVGHEKGRSYKGTHGDGILTGDGRATNPSWPIGKENSGGIGFRGGGFYGYERDYHAFNPFSPVSFRPYGGWHGGMRSIAYGTRFVRTID